MEPSREDKASELEVVRHIRRLRESPPNVGLALSKGIEAIQAGVVLFEKDPPEIEHGISKMGTSLLESLDAVLSPEGKAAWKNYDSFAKSWKKLFEQLPTTVGTVAQNVQTFSSTGQTSHLVKAIHEILDQGSQVVYGSAPNQVGKEIAKYLGSLKETVGSLGEALSGFEKGDIATGISDLYFGLRRATDPLLPDHVKSHDAYDLVVGTTDSVIGSLSRHVLEYRQRLLEKSVCWKQAAGRDRTRPSVCPAENYEWDDESHCWPSSEDCWMPHEKCVTSFTMDGFTFENCTTYKSDHQPWCSHNADYNFWNQWGWDKCIKVPCGPAMTPLTTTLEGGIFGKKPEGSIPAECAVNSEYPEKIDDWCFARCQDGFVSDGSDHKCWTGCDGHFPADDGGLMCGRNPMALQIVHQEMIATSIRSALSIAVSIGSMFGGQGVNSGALGNTINSFVDLGKPFARPLCTNDLLR